MRTTIAIEDSVLAEAKAAADARGVTLGEYVTDVLRAALSGLTAGPPPNPYEVTVFGKPGHLAFDAQAIADLVAEDDLRSISWDPSDR